MIYNCASHIGKVRKNNEDYCKGEIIDTDFGSVGIFALADGMGGHNKGEVASKLAVENIIEFLKENLLQSSNIPVVQSDRGGQITYHGPGQQVMYVLIDIKRHEHLNVRQLVTALEQSVVKTLADYGIEGYPKPDAPGVYIDGKKICSLGLRIRKGCSFHGLAFNINMDLNPFHYINPCGYAGLEMCQLADFIGKEEATLDKVSPKLIKHFAELLGYNVTNL